MALVSPLQPDDGREMAPGIPNEVLIKCYGVQKVEVFYNDNRAEAAYSVYSAYDELTIILDHMVLRLDAPSYTEINHRSVKRHDTKVGQEKLDELAPYMVIVFATLRK